VGIFNKINLIKKVLRRSRAKIARAENKKYKRGRKPGVQIVRRLDALVRLWRKELFIDLNGATGGLNKKSLSVVRLRHL
jgi:hypothetical protein